MSERGSGRRPAEPSGLFRPEERPVVLPTEKPAQPRALVAWITVFVVVTGIVAGLVYQQRRQDAGSDVTRLLPASTSLFLHGARPWYHLAAAWRLDRWQDPVGLAEASDTRGLLARGGGGHLGDLPLPVLRSVLGAADAVRIASVPSVAGPALLVFIRLEDPWARRRVQSSLAPHVETVDRYLGHPLQEFLGLPTWVPWLDESRPVRLATLDEELVLAFGPHEALEDLVEARVTGRSQPVAQRADFDVAAARDPARPGWGFLDPAQLAPPLARVLARWRPDPAHLRVALDTHIASVTIDDRVGAQDELLAARITLAESARAEELTEAFAGRPRSITARLAAHADVLISLSLADPAAALATVTEAVPRLAAAAGLESAVGPAPAWLGAAQRLLDPGSGPSPFTGELVWARTAPDPGGRADAGGWVLAAGLRHPERFEARIPATLAGLDLAWGVIHSDGPTLHVAVPARQARPGEVRAAWMVHGDFVVLAADVPTVSRALTWLVVEPASQDVAAYRRAVGPLHDAAPVLAVARARALKPVDLPALGAPWSRLRPEFAVAATLDIDPAGLELRSNVGLYTVLVALLAADAHTVDGLEGSGLSAECRAAYLSLCREQPENRLCAPFQPDRRFLLQRACPAVAPEAP